MDTSYEHPLSIESMKHSIDSFWVGSTRVLFVLPILFHPSHQKTKDRPRRPLHSDPIRDLALLSLLARQMKKISRHHRVGEPTGLAHGRGLYSRHHHPATIAREPGTAALMLHALWQMGDVEPTWSCGGRDGRTCVVCARSGGWRRGGGGAAGGNTYGPCRSLWRVSLSSQLPRLSRPIDLAHRAWAFISRFSSPGATA
jgi:hypothetical protein